MHIFYDPQELKKYLTEQSLAQRRIGFVPTMGALHDGHLSLVNQAATENDLAVASIFVNPTQFNKAEDLRRYPREPEKDIVKLRDHSRCSVVFLPKVEHLYPNGEETDRIDLGGIDQGMEGSHRPGHFDGVATVVKRFFEMIRPHRAYFGEKDFQQLAVIRQMTSVLKLPVEVIGHPTERSSEGLALSSRNLLLNKEELDQALLIIKSLRWMQENYRHFLPRELKVKVEKDFAASGLVLEYVEVTDNLCLKPIDDWGVTKDGRAFIAARVSGVRLIDNLSLF